jgi:hypothetical protein
MKYLPHEYTLREWHADDEPAFLGMVALIRSHGHVENFGRRRRLIYLRVDGWRYWCMSPPERPLAEVIAVTTLINRAEVDERGRPSKGPRWLREGIQDAAQTRLDTEGVK